MPRSTSTDISDKSRSKKRKHNQRQRSPSSDSSSSSSASSRSERSTSNHPKTGALDKSNSSKKKRKTSNSKRKLSTSSSSASSYKASKRKKEKKKKHKKVKKNKKKEKNAKTKRTKEVVSGESTSLAKAAFFAEQSSTVSRTSVGTAAISASLDQPVGPSPRVMKPMTKEEWEKQQSIMRHVFDEESGRMRLIKGDGEVIEEIVSKERQKDINKMATQGDGKFFASKMGLL